MYFQDNVFIYLIYTLSYLFVFAYYYYLIKYIDNNQNINIVYSFKQKMAHWKNLRLTESFPYLIMRYYAKLSEV